MPRKPFNEELHPRGFGGKFGHGTGTKKVAPKAAPQAKAATPPKKYSAKDVTSGSAMKGRPPVAAQGRSFWEKAGVKRPAKGKGPKPVPRPAGFNSPVRASKPAQRATTPKGQRFEMLAVGRQPDGSMDFNVRAQYADRVLTEWRNDGFDTQSLYRDKKTGEWSPERLAQQEQLIEDIWYAHAANVPNQGRAIFSGGLGGAGKGHALGKVHKVDTDADWEHPGERHDFFTINPDTVKAMMAQRGMIPLDVDPNLTPMELSPLAHEEASELADRLAERAYMERKNVVWDFTMASEKSVVKKRLEPMREAGYDQVTAMFVDTTVDNSIAQATKRWTRGMDDFVGGKGDGGRFLPSGATNDNRPTDGSGFNSKNRETFEAVKDKFDGYVVMENLGVKDAAGKPVPMKQIDQAGIALGGKARKQGARKSDALDVEAMTEELGNRFDAAPDWMKETGADWYPASREWVQFAVEGTDFTPEQGAAVIAAFSPNTDWNRNLVLALNFIKGRPLGKDDGKGTLTDNIKRGERVRDGVDFDGAPVKDPIQSLIGENKEGAYKISNFYRNITGNQEAVTVDRWAVRAAVAGVDDDTAAKMVGQKGTYAKVADAYRQAAKKAGVTPATMQAIVWGQIRGSFE